MRYRKLDADGDMIFGHGGEDYFRDQAEAVAQSILTRLRLWRTEWYLDVGEGTPYMQEVFGRNKLGSAARALRSRILDTEGVKSITALTADVDRETRKLVFACTVETDFGEVTVNG